MGVKLIPISKSDERSEVIHHWKALPKNWPFRPPNFRNHEDYDSYQNEPMNTWPGLGGADLEPHKQVDDFVIHKPIVRYPLIPKLDPTNLDFSFNTSSGKNTLHFGNIVRNGYVSPRHAPVATIVLATLAAVFCIVILLIMFAYARRHRRENRSLQNVVEAEQPLTSNPPGSSQDHNNGFVRVIVNSTPQRDSPPSYSNCATKDKIKGKTLNVACEELPPPYSSCVGPSTNINKEPNIGREKVETSTYDIINIRNGNTIQSNRNERNGFNI